LFIAKEILVLELASIHNLHFYLQLVKQARKHIIDGDYCNWKNEIVKNLSTNINSIKEE
jgi:queuine tRNA-ribosyltransferase